MTCFLTNDTLKPGDVISKSIPDNVASKHRNCADTGDGFDGPFDTSNLARSCPKPESSDDRDTDDKDHEAVRVDEFLLEVQNKEMTDITPNLTMLAEVFLGHQ